jgi:diaminohydroxyphosphoribosylaminopyrimidine deaminase/5-amino-6-(5-phosphoribosylamino)uracil reductase
VNLDRAWEKFMRVAIAEAKKGLGRTTPNPTVGAVLVKDGQIVASGHHVKAGCDHAEVAALRKLDFAAEGCELFTTLEPCNHTGRTGPCTEAIIRSGVRRVYVGALDPNPKVAGGGVERLKAAGLEMICGVLEEECAGLNEPYNFAIVERRPFVVLKAAISLDGRVATRSGQSKWITSEEARAEGRRLRDQLDVVVVGADTVLADDPELTCRFEGAHDPVRVVLDSTLRIPERATVVRSAREAPTIVATTKRASAKKAQALEKRGVEILTLKKTKDGRVDPERLLAALFERGLNGVLVEGGPTIHGAFVDAKLVDKAILFVAPILIGGVDAKSAIAGRGAARLEDALELQRLSVSSVGRDLMIVGYCSPFARIKPPAGCSPPAADRS